MPDNGVICPRGSRLPVAVGLCPDPGHTDEFFMPLDEERSQTCPECNLQLVVYVRKCRHAEAYREALVKINDMGAVCADFMECSHRSCRDSCAAKLTALAALEAP